MRFRRKQEEWPGPVQTLELDPREAYHLELLRDLHQAESVSEGAAELLREAEDKLRWSTAHEERSAVRVREARAKLRRVAEGHI